MKLTIKPLIISGIIASLSACSAITEVTSSTSSTTDAVTPDITLNNFIDKRYYAIRKDAAKGGGENIDALAQLMGKQDSQQLASWMQANYSEIFADNSQPQELVAKIEHGLTPKG